MHFMVRQVNSVCAIGLVNSYFVTFIKIQAFIVLLNGVIDIAIYLVGLAPIFVRLALYHLEKSLYAV
jgi:type IV secretory pathway VirB6-like protein